MKLMKQKGFAPILVLVGIMVIIVVAGGAYYVSKDVNTPPDIVPVMTSPPKPVVSPQSTLVSDETANWKTFQFKKTYKKGDLNFSILYPNNWQVVTGTDNVRWFTENMEDYDIDDYSLKISWLDPDVIYKLIHICAGDSCKKVANILTEEGLAIEIWQLNEAVRAYRKLPSSFLHATIANSEKRVLPEFNTMVLSQDDFKKILSTFKFTQ